MRRLGTLVAVTFLLAAGAASAGEVLMPKSSPNTTVFRAFSGETNNLEVNGNYAFFDSLALLTAGTGCTAAPDGSSASCPGKFILEAYLKDQDDFAHVRVSGRASVWAGSGDDTVRADSFSGPTFVYGDGGNDTITAGGEGGQVADGGPGNDIVNAGGFAGDGTGLGGSGNDTIYFSTGLGGLATLDGGNGDDTIISEPSRDIGPPRGGGTAAGGDGDDIIAIHGAVPRGWVGGEGFNISGGAGADTIIGNVDPDRIDGGDGRDYIDVLDGGADTVTCGPGTDVVRYDATDTVAADCEILLGPSP